MMLRNDRPGSRLIWAWLTVLLAGAGCREGASPRPDSAASSASSTPRASKTSEWLEDVTDRMGVRFVHDVGPLGTYFMPESLGSGVAIFDFDGDGRMDLFLLQNAGADAAARHQLFRQESEGRFRDVSAGSGLDLPGRGMGVAVGDVDNDGRADVLITEYEQVRLFRNLGDGKFEEITTSAGLANPHWGMSAAFFDYDRDGWLDLVVVNYINYSASNACHDPQGRPTYCGPSGFPGTAPRLFRNRSGEGAGVRFDDVTVPAGLAPLTAPGLGVSIADADGDGWPDLVIANDGHVNWLLINRRDGTFSEEAARRGLAYNDAGAVQANMGIALGDVDGDGLFDVAMTHLATETHTLWRQGPRGLFQDRTAISRIAATAWRGTGFGAVFTDLDNDGAPDLVLVNGGIKRAMIEPAPAGIAHGDSFWNEFAQRSQILLNNGDGVFTDVSTSHPAFTGTASVARGLAVGDLDNDGGPDLVVTRIGAAARIYRNTAPRGHWLTVRVVEPDRGGRDAYGAEVVVESGDGQRRRFWVNPSQSYLCSNDPRAHFGLGTVRRVERIEVVWPDGTVEQFPGIDADRVVTLQKGSGTRVGGLSGSVNGGQAARIAAPE